jgi:serine/threonine protein phosphatase PrpC
MATPVIQGTCGEEGAYVVCDGHGDYGAEMAQLAANELTKVITRRYETH